MLAASIESCTLSLSYLVVQLIFSPPSGEALHRFLRTRPDGDKPSVHAHTLTLSKSRAPCCRHRRRRRRVHTLTLTKSRAPHRRRRHRRRVEFPRWLPLRRARLLLLPAMLGRFRGLVRWRLHQSSVSPGCGLVPPGPAVVGRLVVCSLLFPSPPLFSPLLSSPHLSASHRPSVPLSHHHVVLPPPGAGPEREREGEVGPSGDLLKIELNYEGISQQLDWHHFLPGALLSLSVG